MSVFTRVERHELESFLTHYSLGQLVDHQGISAGIENTNYFVTTDQGQYVLTLFEKLGMDELPYFLDLTAHLAEHGVPSAHPMADLDGCYLRTLNGKPATLVQALTDICDTVMVFAEKVSIASSLPVFSGIDATLVLVTGKPLGKGEAEAISVDAEALGFRKNLVIVAAEQKARVA